nr:FecR domain-containing protein [Chitinophaga nivalis]
MLQYLDSNDLSELESIAAEEFQQTGENVTAVLDKPVSERLLKSIHARISFPGKSSRNVIALYGKSVAAAAILLLLAGTAWYTLSHRQEKALVLSSQSARRIVTLPDGSVVHLEKGATITYPANFGQKKREVQLKGEAYFEVNHNAGHPFIITSDLINTTVLGTSFNMEVQGGKEAKVVVVSGMVQVNTRNGNNQHAQLVLTANKSAVYNRAAGKLELHDATDDARFFSQKRNGKFVYKGLPLAAVVEDLRRFYNVPVQTNGKIAQCNFYGDFSTNDDLEKALNLIALTLNARIEKNNNNNGYTIVGGSCR